MPKIKPSTQNGHLRQVTRVGEGRVSLSQPRLPSQGRSPSSPQYWVLLYLCLHPLTHNDHVQQGNTWGGTCFLGSATASIPRPQWGVITADPILGVLPTYAYAVWPRATKFGVVTHIGWDLGGCVLGGQSLTATTLLLHKCVARFVRIAEFLTFISTINTWR